MKTVMLVRMLAGAATLCVSVRVADRLYGQVTARPIPAPGARSAAATNATPATDFSMGPTIPQDDVWTSEISRRVLVVYDSSEQVDDEDYAGHTHRRAETPVTNRAHTLLGLPLDHLGLVTDYCDIATAALPDRTAMQKYRGVVTWFADERMNAPERYLTWLIAQSTAGRPVLVFEHIGAYADSDNRPVAPTLLAQAFRAIGGRDLGEETSDPSAIATLNADPQMLGFEAALPERHSYYRKYQANRNASVFLRLERTDRRTSTSDAVWIAPGGAFVMQSIAFVEDQIGERWVRRWLINPFLFLTRALAWNAPPRFDTTTLNGRRLFYSHIDGDGLEILSELDSNHRCGEVIRREIIERYDLPFTASVVVGATAPPPLGRGSQKDLEVARSIFARPNVEIGSHGWAHPMDWQNDRQVAIPDLSPTGFDPQREVAASAAYINQELAPPGKVCKIMLWTGMTNPDEQTLAVAYANGLRNLNGGDGRMDAHFPSYLSLPPQISQVGQNFQYFTSAANDFIMTEGWHSPFYRFANIIQTFERGGAPRRVIPVNVYFHFYSGRNAAALKALHQIFDWTLEQQLAPIFASEYVDIVRDAHWARIGQDSAGSWIVRKGSQLRTLRFDRPDVSIDLEKSPGVLGFLQVPELNSTYIHLDGRPEVKVTLGQPKTPYLQWANQWIDEWRVGVDSAIHFRLRGFGPVHIGLAGLPAGQRYRMSGTEFVVEPTGRLALTLAAGVTEIDLEPIR